MALIEHMCYYSKVKQKGGDMRLLKLAVEKQRWDLAAHTIVLATARVLVTGDKLYVRKNKEKKRNVKDQSKR